MSNSTVARITYLIFNKHKRTLRTLFIQKLTLQIISIDRTVHTPYILLINTNQFTSNNQMMRPKRFCIVFQCNVEHISIVSTPDDIIYQINVRINISNYKFYIAILRSKNKKPSYASYIGHSRD